MTGQEMSMAWNAFAKDPANAATFDGRTSGVYLRNRLERAFLAGIQAAERARQQDARGEATFNDR